MKIEEARRKIEKMLNDPYGSHGINAIKQLFKSLLDCGQGYMPDHPEGKSGPSGYLDSGNIAAVSKVLSDKQTTLELCHMVYYGEQWVAVPVINMGDDE